MLALDLVEQLRRLPIAAAIEPVLGGIVERVHIAGDVGEILLAPAAGRAGSGEQGKAKSRGEGLEYRNTHRMHS
jgi:hypothetical protein